MSDLIGKKVQFVVAHHKKSCASNQKEYPKKKCSGFIVNVFKDTAIIQCETGGVYNRFLKDIIVQDVTA